MNQRRSAVSTSLLALLPGLAFGCTSGEDQAAPVTAAVSASIDFDALALDSAPPGFTGARSGDGVLGTWHVEQDGAANRVLAQISTDDTDKRYPLCIFDGFSAKDVQVSCRFKALSGSVDQAAGLVARYRDENYYYVVRANALEDNVRLYRVVNGKRQQIGGEDLTVGRSEWHELRLDARGSRFEVFYDGKSLFTADDTILPEAGKVGVWTKADSVTWFDDLHAGELKP